MLGDLPPTERINARQALETLTYAEMAALSRMFDRWARERVGLSMEQSEKCARLARDYAAMAQFAGRLWEPTNLGPKVDAMQFAAREELAATGEHHGARGAAP